MKEDYTQGQLNEMQEDALKRAMDMLERATSPKEEDKGEPPPPSPEGGRGPLFNFLSPDRDKALILPLLLLLGREDTDNILLLALMYIMA